MRARIAGWIVLVLVAGSLLVATPEFRADDVVRLLSRHGTPRREVTKTAVEYWLYTERTDTLRPVLFSELRLRGWQCPEVDPEALEATCRLPGSDLESLQYSVTGERNALIVYRRPFTPFERLRN
jgi:hypothetical protein